MRLDGRVALVVGGGRGIGAAVARAMVAEGALVFLIARTAAELEQSARATGSPESVGYATADASDAEALRLELASCERRFGGVDILVNAAAVHGPIGPLWEVDGEAWWRACEINVRSTVNACAAVVPGMLARGWGRIINFSGGGATTPRPGFSAYAASKAAVVRLTETLAEELRGTGITVNAVAPGTVDTRLQDDVLDAGARAGRDYATIRELRATGRGGVPAELAASLAVQLASSEAAGLTGKLISAVHDDWRSWDAARTQQLADSPWLTLRRLDPYTVAPLSHGPVALP